MVQGLNGYKNEYGKPRVSQSLYTIMNPIILSW